jgi:hypothetical protein
MYKGKKKEKGKMYKGIEKTIKLYPRDAKDHKNEDLTLAYTPSYRIITP